MVKLWSPKPKIGVRFPVLLPFFKLCTVTTVQRLVSYSYARFRYGELVELV